MKKIISIIPILAGIVFMNSCRQQEDEQYYDEQMNSTKIMGKEIKKHADSVQQTSFQSEYDENGNIITDPPPKNGGQWKIQN
ncbi:hypothetical protein [Sphingobacterium sp. DR205]|uniref:hypothetical protein n=1 Tax=Sphingobacterium sp. DR205 TaxID=2713573 RepID=UPI0013E51ED1|nr:hypothetical protein [Sphingobacterium sp. DR205]QIH34471.1 hypothetical protein G6053_16940 [Sphingobacterium sp. DR205]